MAQKPKVQTVTLATAGTRQRLVDVANPAEGQFPRYAVSVYFECPSSNGSGSIYIGDENVSSTVYSTKLKADQGSQWVGDQVLALGGPQKNKIDLYNMWLDASANGLKVLVTVSVDS